MASRPYTRSIRGLPGSVYVVAAEGGLIKIGVATNPPRRLAALQGGSPVRLTVLGVKRSASPACEERALHMRFDAVRHHGEWFRDGPEIREWLRSEFQPDEVLTLRSRQASDFVWDRGGSRCPAGDRAVINERAAAFANLRAA